MVNTCTTCERIQNKFGATLLDFVPAKHICGVKRDSFTLYQSHQIDKPQCHSDNGVQSWSQWSTQLITPVQRNLPVPE